jgi:hypothetical protein
MRLIIGYTIRAGIKSWRRSAKNNPEIRASIARDIKTARALLRRPVPRHVQAVDNTQAGIDRGCEYRESRQRLDSPWSTLWEISGHAYREELQPAAPGDNKWGMR